MILLKIVSTNRNIFINITNKEKIIFKKSLGSYNLDIKDLKLPINTKKIAKDISLFLIKKKIKTLGIHFNGFSNWTLIRLIILYMKKNVFFSYIKLNANQPFNGTRTRKKRRL